MLLYSNQSSQESREVLWLTELASCTFLNFTQIFSSLRDGNRQRLLLLLRVLVCVSYRKLTRIQKSSISSGSAAVCQTPHPPACPGGDEHITRDSQPPEMHVGNIGLEFNHHLILTMSILSELHWNSGFPQVRVSLNLRSNPPFKVVLWWLYGTESCSSLGKGAGGHACTCSSLGFLLFLYFLYLSFSKFSGLLWQIFIYELLKSKYIVTVTVRNIQIRALVI